MRQRVRLLPSRGTQLPAWVALMSLAVSACQRGDPNKLWEIVHDECEPHFVARQDPGPCAEVSIAGGEAAGYVLLKDIHGPYQYLLIPTARLTGIESPALLGDPGARYFQAAWEGRRLFEKAVGHPLPVDAISLAVNSRYGRSQEQLHIHIDCLKPEVRSALKAHLAKIDEHWSELPYSLEGRHYRARRAIDTSRHDLNPFRLLADASPEIAAEMGRHTLVVAGAVFEDGTEGFVLLEDRATLWPPDRAHGEDLQDHLCR